MFTSLRALGAALPLVLAATAAAQPTALKLHSKVLGEARTVTVRTPPHYDGKTAHPILYVLDGETQLELTSNIVEYLVRQERMPEVIIVGIQNTRRTRDLTPTKGTLPGEELEGLEESGGGERFLTFIETELIPFIEKRYPASGFRMLAGHSFGGLFSLYTLVKRPALFQAIIAASPSFPWDDSLLARITSASPPTQRASLFFTMANEAAVAVSGFENYKKLLGAKASKELSWGARYFEDEDHGSVVLPTWYYGLRHVFAGWQLPWPKATSLEAIEAHAAELSRRFGFAIPPSEAQINMLGYRTMAKNETAKALEIFRRNVALHPQSANAHDSLGELYEKRGELALAQENYAKAWTLGARRKDPNLGTYQANLARVRKLKKQKSAAVSP